LSAKEWGAVEQARNLVKEWPLEIDDRNGQTEEAKPRLSYTWGAKAFFGEGHWRNKRGWPWKPGEEQTTSRPIVQAKVDDPVGDIRAARTTSMAHIRRAMGIGGRNEPHSA
jgi:hypothetical protein